eukprot:TRINITY_DN48273_c0_g1_i1.p1 TRINITY_DN48273_c0_g1~~TRINITY_DN48273_c0_g1_i1.p1  ORF type:complete len:406 (+),score=42.73 TRINITY_DN48273_c0_g1_i1:139-1218(+)
MPKKFHGFEEFFTKHITVLSSPFDGSKGIHVFASSKVPDKKVERVANVLAEYLDNDEDGVVDNPDVVMELAKRGATMIMFSTSKEMDKSGFYRIPGFFTQDVGGDETSLASTDDNSPRGWVLLASSVATSESHRCAHRADKVCDAALEEVFHLITNAGYAHAYPKEFSLHPGSAISVTMDALIGDCGFASFACPVGRYSEFRYPNCTGLYHYSDASCDYACLATEYLHHFIATYNGEYFYNGCPPTSREWELCSSKSLAASREMLKKKAPDAYRLILDSFFRIPQSMPDGKYDPSGGILETSDWNESVNDNVSDVYLWDYKVTLGGSLRQRYHLHKRAGMIELNTESDVMSLEGVGRYR